MLCDEYRCPNVARVTLYGRHMNEHQKVDVCTAHQYIYKQLGYEEQVLDDWKAEYEKLPTENIFRNLVKKMKRK